MFTKIVYTSTVLAALAAAAPAPQVAGYVNGDASFSVSMPTGMVASVFGPDSQVPVGRARGLSMLVLTTSGPPYQRPFSSATKEFEPDRPYQPWTLLWYSYHHWRREGIYHPRYRHCA